MALTIQVVSYNDLAPDNALSMTVNESGCTIGRAKNCSFLLPDKERIVSHTHASIQFENGLYYLTDNSTNGTYLNHAPNPVGLGNKILLHDGDILSMGKYECAISLIESVHSTLDSLFHDAVIPPPYHKEAGQLSWEQQSFDKPDSTPTAPPVEKPPLTFEQDYFRPPEALPEDWNILTGMKPNIKQQAAVSIDTAPAKISKSEPSYPPAYKHNADHLASRNATNVKNKTANSQQALHAFLDGAGLTHTTIRPEDTITFMNTAGRVLHELTQGYREVLDARASLKGEFRLGMTTLRPAKNNPLKFSIDVEDALTKLLLPPPKGYLPPLDAIHEATDDLQAHQMALLAGLRAALGSLVALFDPNTLEENFQKSSAVDNLLPALKKAKYWEMFKSRYKQAASDAENDFLHILGNEFTIAYEQQVARLKSVRHKIDS